MYFFYGNEQFLINREIKKIISKLPNHKITICSGISFDQLLEKIDSKDIFINEEVLVIKDTDLFLNPEVNKLIDLLNSIKINKEKVIIFSCFFEKKERKIINSSLFKFLLSNSFHKELNKIDIKEKNEYIKKIIKAKKGEISELDLIYLASLLPNDLMFISKEIDKLLIYNTVITKTSIQKLVFLTDLDNDFALINSLSNLNIEEIWKVYKEKTLEGFSINNLIGQIFSFFNVLFQVIHFDNKKISEKELAEKIKIHPFRIKKAKEFLKNNRKDEKYVFNIIKKLSELDFLIKSGKMQEKEGFETFLIYL
ncbi:DNA polymerase III subunit delta [Mycoplasma sp. 480]|uniref:DNA polymerase III subunit delta n=1 Tax=Mycoplasma sp. 480 TaxID=3440155 RepID=UPI003F51A8E6